VGQAAAVTAHARQVAVTGGDRTPLPWDDELPLVGRDQNLRFLRDCLLSAERGGGQCVLLSGETGIGKSRLLQALIHDAQSRAMCVAAGSAFAVESGVPYSAVADALTRTLMSLDPTTLSRATLGLLDDMRAVIPTLRAPDHTPATPVSTDDSTRGRLFWSVTQCLTRIAAQTPLLLVIDNAHACDASSLALLHFLARQLAGTRVLLVLAYVESEADAPGLFRDTIRSLRTTAGAALHRVEQLTRADLTTLLAESCLLTVEDAEHHAAALWSHTRGNPFFVDALLQAMTTSGHLRKQGAVWVMDDTALAALPTTVRDAVLVRLDTLSPAARRIAEIASVVEHRASLPLLSTVSAFDPDTLADALDVLCVKRILAEMRDGNDTFYEFAHPIVQSTVRGTLTAARERALHVAIASALESLFGAHALLHAAELAPHLLRGQEAGGDQRTQRYLTAAGKDALSRRADVEAVQWFTEALRIADARGADSDSAALMEPLAQALLRSGDPGAAVLHWERALALATACNDQPAQMRIALHLAQHAARRGDARRGLEILDSVEALAAAQSLPDVLVRLGITRTKMQQALGRRDDATRTIGVTLAQAEAVGDVMLQARAHQAALQLYAWTGPAAVARTHGARALALAEQCGDRDVAWGAHWAMAMLAGFSGDADGVAAHMREAAALADALASPTLQAMTSEIMIEYASGVGRWDEALLIAERTIPFARAVLPQTLLPRLLVWTGLIVLERDDTERARGLLEEAWTLSAADRIGDVHADALQDVGNVNNVILAHTGMGTYYLAHGDWTRALEYGERGLALANRFGYLAWAIHRLIPLVIEARLRTQDFDRVETLTAQLREQSTALGHRLGSAWASAADALVARMKFNRPDAAAQLLAAAAELDAVPFVFHAAKMRRNAAQVLTADGDVSSAVRELRRAHEVFVRLGAAFELRGVRNQLRQLGARPPALGLPESEHPLTDRELEIARAVARRLSNKEIGASLNISTRTVSTHLSNIFVKLRVDSRGALTDYVRERLSVGE
jgi:DNA-binding NarL/FixJ family response regulator